MRVPVMDIREMRMRVRHGCMAVRMGMRLVAVPREVVLVLVMRVVPVTMRVLERIVRVRMLMTFANVQPHAERHQRCSDPEKRRRQFGPQKPG
jgi:hypothetical protein